jgi:hypothetical protein
MILTQAGHEMVVTDQFAYQVRQDWEMTSARPQGSQGKVPRHLEYKRSRMRQQCGSPTLVPLKLPNEGEPGKHGG